MDSSEIRERDTLGQTRPQNLSVVHQSRGITLQSLIPLMRVNTAENTTKIMAQFYKTYQAVPKFDNSNDNSHYTGQPASAGTSS